MNIHYLSFEMFLLEAPNETQVSGHQLRRHAGDIVVFGGASASDGTGCGTIRFRKEARGPERAEATGSRISVDRGAALGRFAVR